MLSDAFIGSVSRPNFTEQQQITPLVLPKLCVQYLEFSFAVVREHHLDGLGELLPGVPKGLTVRAHVEGHSGVKRRR